MSRRPVRSYGRHVETQTPRRAGHEERINWTWFVFPAFMLCRDAVERWDGGLSPGWFATRGGLVGAFGAAAFFAAKLQNRPPLFPPLFWDTPRTSGGGCTAFC